MATIFFSFKNKRPEDNQRTRCRLQSLCRFFSLFFWGGGVGGGEGGIRKRLHLSDYDKVEETV